ncbi:uncharacterized protein BKA78DRAFT_311869 [Phyllosticta capitalensis]|uniref:Secreted protein n=1 Tax=Phyllosticta capitalensis TaxID=121624 RepID=A0ABR1YW77_9PEZI
MLRKSQLAACGVHSVAGSQYLFLNLILSLLHERRDSSSGLPVHTACVLPTNRSKFQNAAKRESLVLWIFAHKVSGVLFTLRPTLGFARGTTSRRDSQAAVNHIFEEEKKKERKKNQNQSFQLSTFIETVWPNFHNFWFEDHALGRSQISLARRPCLAR